MKRKVILVTDGDLVAKAAVETAARNIGARCISSSAGNPTEKTGREIINLIRETPHDPVVVMVDDRGKVGEGKGEAVMREIAATPDIDVLGVVAVASNSEGEYGVKVNYSITNNGEIVPYSVDKEGVETKSKILLGDTVGVINTLDIPLVIGIGDPGKMNFMDDVQMGAPITTKAFVEILKNQDIMTEKVQKGNKQCSQ